MNLKQDLIIKKLLEKIETKDKEISKLKSQLNTLAKYKKKYCEEDCKDCEYCDFCEDSEGCDENREKEYEEIETERLIKNGHSDQCAVNQAFAGSQCNCKNDIGNSKRKE